jgi:hypothetical protein
MKWEMIERILETTAEKARANEQKNIELELRIIKMEIYMFAPDELGYDKDFLRKHWMAFNERDKKILNRILQS